ncbi:MAG: hypothetical protein J6Q45_04310 [Alistipes sp.]|nr:hypothetical protein [Alistipes sp.]
MKKLFYSFAMLIALVGCSDGGDDPVVEPTTGDDKISATGITVESPEGLSFAWEEGSTISLFRSKTNEKFVYNSASNEFEKKDKLEKKEPMDANYGVMPYKGTTRVANGEVKMEFPSRQTYAANGVCFAENPMVGVSASASTTDMQFKNLGGYAVVKVYGTAVIKSIAIEGMNGETLAGTAMVAASADAEPTFSITALPSKTVTVTAETPVELGLTAEEATPFYLMVPPTTFEAGFIVILTDSYGNVRKKNFKVDDENPAVSIARNEVVEIATIELAEKLPTKTILDVQFNEDGTATDEGIYGLEVVLVDESGVDPFVYKHPKFKENNIARFNHNAHNNRLENTGYYKIDYSANEEMKATIADGFALEVVTLNTAWSFDWWSVPVSTDAFRLMRQGDLSNNPWTFTYNNGGGWWPGNVTGINATLEKNKYHHTVYMYDADNMQVQVYQDGILSGLKEGVAEFLPGQWLSIGGTLDNGNSLAMQWNGEVALVRMYDQILEPAEIAEKFNDLKLPEEGSVAPKVTINTPMLDVKFNENKTAQNVGSLSDLVVSNAAEMGHNMDNTDMINVDGFGWVPKFKTDPHNGDSWDNWYRIPYTDEFKSKLEDGFTFEILCFHDGNPGDFYVRPVSADKWCVHLRCNGGGGFHYWQTCVNADDGHWSQWGQQYNGYGNNNNKPVFNKDTGVVMTSYAHYVLVWDAAAGKFGTFVDGNYNGGDITAFNVGNVLNICGMPHRDGQAQHGWRGKVAMVRVYDEVFTQEHVLARYNELQPAIEKLNATN